MRSTRWLLSGLLCWFLSLTPAFAGRTVVIDAGHGGIDRGGVPGQKLAEKVYTLDVARRLRSRLQRAGFSTVMTRSDDTFVGLRQRCAIANSYRNSIFIAIHFNSAPRVGASGIETYFYSRGSAPLAAAVHREVVRTAGTLDRHVRQRGFYVIRNTRSPSVLAELGFLTNPQEGRRITSGSYRQQLADALARAIISKYR
jgi:N-acetylmuramoyl-L-alanine amidase